MRAATAAAQAAFKTWRDVPIQQRQRVMFKLQQLIRDRTEDLAQCITREQGKTLADARGDVFRGLEVVELVCGAASLTMGETLEQVASGECLSSLHSSSDRFYVLRDVAGIVSLCRRLDSS